MAFRNSIAQKQIADRSEWAINASGALMLSVPHVFPDEPTGLSFKAGVCSISCGPSGTFAIDVPDLVRPFLDHTATVLLVTFRRTNIVSERDVFVDRD